MTHEYVIALGGVILGARGDATGSARAERPPFPTAIAWAADRVLAVGEDEPVSAISRGDSIFLDLAGCAVTPAPSDPLAAERVLRAAIAAGRPFDPVAVLASAGLVAPDASLEPGSPADLAYWTADPRTVAPAGAADLRIAALVRDGAFTAGDEHAGPFGYAPPA